MCDARQRCASHIFCLTTIKTPSEAFAKYRNECCYSYETTYKTISYFCDARLGNYVVGARGIVQG